MRFISDGFKPDDVNSGLKTTGLTDRFDDGVLQRFLFSRGGFEFSHVVVVTSQLVVDALPELSQ